MKNTMHDILETARATGTFTTFVAAVSATDLGKKLKDPGSFTVFAPDDEAFSKMSSRVIEELFKPGNKDKLSAIMLMHVIEGTVLARYIIGDKVSSMSLSGEVLRVKGGNRITVNGARVTKTDIACFNGVIHVIDRVLHPRPTAVNNGV